MTDTTAVYAEIVKHERDANGDLMVYGRATSPDLDLDQQICDPVWLEKAMPDWFSTGGNVREQHSPIAAGVATELEKADGDAWMLRSRIVDPTSARKVEAGVLKGYSVGIRAPRVVKDAAARGGRIVDGQIVEVSLVDRPANPTCTLTLAKALKPGPAATVGAIDQERHLVKVEELHDRSAEPLEALKALGVDLGKGDQGRDIATAQQAISCIAGLIQHEAECLADGMASEACDIELLLSAVRALEWFICREREEPTVAHVELAAEVSTEKAAAPDAAQTPAPAPAASSIETPPPAAEKAAEGNGGSNAAPQTDLTELVKAAVAKAVAPLEERLAKAMQQPAPGGPVLTRTTEDTNRAAGRETHLAKAAEYERLAYEVADTNAREGYLVRAAEARKLAG